MADSKSSNKQRHVKYLVQVLQRNPLEESAVIIRGRNRLLGLKEAVASQSRPDVDLNKTRRQREKALQQIEQLRKVIGPLRWNSCALNPVRLKQIISPRFK